LHWFVSEDVGALGRRRRGLAACRGEGSVAGPLLAARALPLRCAGSAVLSSTLAMLNCGAQGAPVWPYISQRFSHRIYSSLAR
jgi:hypothetical protein